MALQWAQLATEAGVGAASGFMSAQRAQAGNRPLWDSNPNDPNSFKLFADTAVEAAALVVGAGLQYFSPRTMPTVADGLTNAGTALVARRVTQHFAGTMGSTATTGTTTSSQAMQAAMAAYAMQNAGFGVASPQIGSYSGLRKNESF